MILEFKSCLKLLPLNSFKNSSFIEFYLLDAWEEEDISLPSYYLCKHKVSESELALGPDDEMYWAIFFCSYGFLNQVELFAYL